MYAVWVYTSGVSYLGSVWMDKRLLSDTCGGIRFLTSSLFDSIQRERKMNWTAGIWAPYTVQTHTHADICSNAYVQYNKYLFLHDAPSTLREETRGPPYTEELFFVCLHVCVCVLELHFYIYGSKQVTTKRARMSKQTQKALRSPPKNVFQPRGFGKTHCGQINSDENLRPFPAL